MSEIKHTPGPWASEREVSGARGDAGCAVIASDEAIKISNPSRGIVAYASRRVGRKHGGRVSKDRLIAAAPDLLDTLKDVLADMIDNMEEVGVEVDGEPIVMRARAAIAKAEGRS